MSEGAGELECEDCNWSGDVSDDAVEQEYDSSGLSWCCPGCGAWWSEE